MHGISLHTKNSWVGQTLDGLDILRDSIPDGCAIAHKMREDGRAADDVLLLAAADIIFAFADYFQNNLEQSVDSFRRLSAWFSEHDLPEGVPIGNLPIGQEEIGQVGHASPPFTRARAARKAA